MKKYVIGTLGVVIVVLVSIIYKKEMATIYKFPSVPENTTIEVDVDVPLTLYVFFSKNNCIDCMEIIGVLNNLPPHFFVSGMVPKKELENEKELREITGARFPLMSFKKYKKYIPWYTPSVLGVSPDGDILFVLPGIPGIKCYLKIFLDSFYAKLYPIFLKDKIPGSSSKNHQTGG